MKAPLLLMPLMEAPTKTSIRRALSKKKIIKNFNGELPHFLALMKKTTINPFKLISHKSSIW